MDKAEFERSLRADGYEQIETKSVAPRTHNEAHDHPFDVKALVLDGQIALTVANESRTYRAGDVFTMAAGCKHVEDVGADGVRYIFGRRRAPSA
jgi:quercetin dioxygenase-like cupin family protein